MVNTLTGPTVVLHYSPSTYMFRTLPLTLPIIIMYIMFNSEFCPDSYTLKNEEY